MIVLLRLRGACICLLLWLAAAAPLAALEVQRVDTSEIGCTILLRGEFTAGASARAREGLLGLGAELHEFDDFSFLHADGRICFDSPGGSFLEGVRLARLLQGATTGVDAGHHCESACFLAFMAGKFNRQEDRPIIPDRVMHPQARVGFHAPGLEIPDRNFLPQEVSLAWDTALGAVAELLRLRVDIADYVFRDELLEAMLRTGSDRMTYIETVGAAAFYNITVFPVLLPFSDELTRQQPVRATHPAFGHVCRALGLLALTFDIDEGPLSPSLSLNDRGEPRYTAYFDPGESGTTCELAYFNADILVDDDFRWWAMDWSLGRMQAEDWWIPANDFEIAAYMHYPAGFRITDLPYSTDHIQRNAAMLGNLTTNERQLECGVEGNLEVINVENYVNIREKAGFEHRVVTQAPLASLLRPLMPGTYFALSHCSQTCAQSADTPQAIIARHDCIARDHVWVEVEDRSGNTGWVSQKFLRKTD